MDTLSGRIVGIYPPLAEGAVDGMPAARPLEMHPDLLEQLQPEAPGTTLAQWVRARHPRQDGGTTVQGAGRHVVEEFAMSLQKTVEEIMVPLEQYPWIRDDATLGDAISAIERARLQVARRRSLPRVLLVFDAIHVLVGYVRRRDILHGLLPEYLIGNSNDGACESLAQTVDPDLTELVSDQIAEATRKREERPVSVAMRPVEAVLDARDHVMKAIQEMVSLDVALLPVLREGRVVGVVRSVDVFQCVAEFLGRLPPGE